MNNYTVNQFLDLGQQEKRHSKEAEEGRAGEDSKQKGVGRLEVGQLKVGWLKRGKEMRLGGS